MSVLVFLGLNTMMYILCDIHQRAVLLSVTSVVYADIHIPSVAACEKFCHDTEFSF